MTGEKLRTAQNCVLWNHSNVAAWRVYLAQLMKHTCTTLAKKNRYSRDIHEIDPQCNHVISCDIDFDLQLELATRRAAGCVDVEPKLDIARFHMIGLSDQPHEFLGCNNFFLARVVLDKTHIVHHSSTMRFTVPFFLFLYIFSAVR